MLDAMARGKWRAKQWAQKVARDETMEAGVRRGSERLAGQVSGPERGLLLRDDGPCVQPYA